MRPPLRGLLRQPLPPRNSARAGLMERQGILILMRRLLLVLLATEGLELDVSHDYGHDGGKKGAGEKSQLTSQLCVIRRSHQMYVFLQQYHSCVLYSLSLFVKVGFRLEKWESTHACTRVRR